eukprot:1372982-Amorphochlora_amoeboformis.AAC.1
MDSKGGKREVFGALLGWTREDCMDFLTESIDLYRKMHELWYKTPSFIAFFSVSEGANTDGFGSNILSLTGSKGRKRTRTS